MTNHATPQDTTDRLFYEWWMLSEAERTLDKPDVDQATENAWIEAAAIHARNLADFLYPTESIQNRKADDVVAQDFLPAGDWGAKRPKAPDSLSRHEFRDPVNKQIAHLTKTGNRKKEWDFSIVATALQPALEEFLRLVPLNTLGTRWRDKLPARTGPRWSGAQRILRERGNE